MSNDPKGKSLQLDVLICRKHVKIKTGFHPEQQIAQQQTDLLLQNTWNYCPPCTFSILHPSKRRGYGQTRRPSLHECESNVITHMPP